MKADEFYKRSIELVKIDVSYNGVLEKLLYKDIITVLDYYDSSQTSLKIGEFISNVTPSVILEGKLDYTNPRVLELNSEIELGFIKDFKMFHRLTHSGQLLYDQSKIIADRNVLVARFFADLFEEAMEG